MNVEINFTKTVDYTWSGDFNDLPAELQANVIRALPTSNIDSHDPDDVAEMIDSEITDIDLDLLATMGADLESESYEVDTVLVS